MQSKAPTVGQYLAELPHERRTAIEAVLKVIRKNVDEDVEEGMQYGMIGFYVPHSVFPKGYHCDPKQPLPFIHVASQKNHMAIYLCHVYMSEGEQRRFRTDWAETGKKLDMGKSCIRFKSLDDLPLELIGETIKRTPTKKFIKFYETVLARSITASVPRKTSKKQ